MKQSQVMARVVCLGLLCLGIGGGSLPKADAQDEAESGSAEALSVGVDELNAEGGESEDAEASPVYEASAGETTAPKQRTARGVKLTAIRTDFQAGMPVVRITTTGSVASSETYLSNPERLLVKLSNTMLIWKPTTLEVGESPLRRIRAAQHGSEVWVVFDLTRPGRWTRTAQADGLILTPAGVKPPAAVAAIPTQAAREETVGASRLFPLSASQAAEGAGYQVVDVSAEDLGEKTRVVVTTDGPVRYRVERERRGDEVTLRVYGAALAWNKILPGLPMGAVSRVTAQQNRLEGEPVVEIVVRMVRPTPYLVLREQNQVVLELDNPALVMEAAPTRGSLQARISVDFQNAELTSVLRALTQDVGFDLVLTPGAQEFGVVSSQVTVTINNQPLDNVLDLILRPRKLAYEVSGNTLRVGQASEFPVETRVFSLKNLDSKRANIKESLEGAFTEGAKSKVILEDSSNRVIVTAIPSDMRRVETVLGNMDVQPRLLSRTYALNYADANKLAALLRPMLTSLGRLEVNERGNALVVSDIPGTVQRLSGLIRSLDTKSKQVMIEAWIVEIALSNEQDLGVNWNANTVGVNPSVVAASFPAAVGAVGTLTVGSLQSSYNLSATLSALEAKGVLNTLSNPRIATMDNQSATLSASQNIPLTNSVISNGVVRTGVEYLELPITLTVTPHISQNNQVLLSPATLTVTTVSGTGTPPETSTRSASTQMTVADGETVAIGGMIRDSERTRESKVPLLGDIPLLGALFKSTSTIKDKVELVVFLTPHVLD